VLPPMEEKEKRKAVHLLLRSELLSPFALAETKDGSIVVWPLRFRRKMKTHKQFPSEASSRKRKREWPGDRPEYLRFVMYKENVDTGTAAREINRHARMKHGKGVAYAGMKDKRGITAQFCTAHRKEPEDLLVVNATQIRSGVLRVGTFSYVHEEIALGKLGGNRFDIVLRNVDVGIVGEGKAAAAAGRMEAAAAALKERGFVNYFGMQRFGKYCDTHEVGLAILKGDFESAAGIIMSEKPDEFPKFAEARAKWARRFQGVDSDDKEARGKAERACAKNIAGALGRFFLCETSLVHALSRNPLDYKRAFATIPRHAQLMFLHAVQSYVWNKAASYRVRTGPANQVKLGDLVLLADNGPGLAGKTVRVLTQEDVESGKYSIFDVVLPLVGSKIQYPENDVNDFIETLMSEQGIAKSHFVHKDSKYSLGGDYRKLACRPFDFDFEIKTYKDPTQRLVVTDLMTIRGETLTPPQPDDALLGIVVRFTLPPSSYATIALRELMKKPTSRVYQSMLTLEGPCEQKVDEFILPKNELSASIKVEL